MDSKTLWEKEKLLVMSNFSFSHSVFKRLVLQTCKNQGLFGKGLNENIYIPLFNLAQVLELVFGTVENIVGKEKYTGYHRFLLFPHFFIKGCFLRNIKILDCVVKD